MILLLLCLVKGSLSVILLIGMSPCHTKGLNPVKYRHTRELLHEFNHESAGQLAHLVDGDLEDAQHNGSEIAPCFRLDREGGLVKPIHHDGDRPGQSNVEIPPRKL